MFQTTAHTKFYLRLAIVLAIAMLVASSAIWLLPLEDHEAFVLVSAQSMHDRHDWVVPWFNGEPRLTKPPMQYWLTALTAYLSGGIDEIQPWHGRLPSVLSAVGIVLLTVIAGRKLFNARHGLLAGLMLASSAGYWYYAHSARPEMVYAFFCTAALVSYIYAVSATGTGYTQRISTKLIWIFFALATLTKGPQIPFVFLVAFMLDLKFRKQSLQDILVRFQPMAGLAIYLLITLPWWWMLHQEVDGIQATQLSGSLIKPDLANLVDPYYFYRSWQLMLPWALLIPIVLITPWARFLASKRLLAVLLAASVILLSLGPQKRWYYMLPLLSPMFLLLTPCILEAFQRLDPKLNHLKRLSWIFVVLPLGFAGGSYTPLAINKQKKEVESLAIAASEHLRKGQQLVLWDVSASEVFIYHTHSQVIRVNDAAQLEQLSVHAENHPILVVTKTERLRDFPPNCRCRIIRQTDKSIGKGLVLLELEDSFVKM